MQVEPDVPLLVVGGEVLLAGRGHVDREDVHTGGEYLRESAQGRVLVDEIRVRPGQQARRVDLCHGAAVGDLVGQHRVRALVGRQCLVEPDRVVHALDGDGTQIRVHVSGPGQLVETLLQIGGCLPAAAVLRGGDEREELVVDLVLGRCPHGSPSVPYRCRSCSDRKIIHIRYR